MFWTVPRQSLQKLICFSHLSPLEIMKLKMECPQATLCKRTYCNLVSWTVLLKRNHPETKHTEHLTKTCFPKYINFHTSRIFVRGLRWKRPSRIWKDTPHPPLHKTFHLETILFSAYARNAMWACSWVSWISGLRRFQDFTDFGISGFRYFRILGFRDFGISGFCKFSISGFQDFRASGFLDFWITGIRDFRI